MGARPSAAARRLIALAQAADPALTAAELTAAARDLAALDPRDARRAWRRAEREARRAAVEEAAAQTRAASPQTAAQPPASPARPKGLAEVERARRKLLLKAADFLPMLVARADQDAGLTLSEAPKARRATLPKLLALAEERGHADAVVSAAKALAKERSLAYDRA